MKSMPGTILAVGAAGKCAGLVVPELARRGAKVRGLIQDAKQEDGVRKRGAVEVAVGNLNDRISLDAALKGVDSVFYLAPAFIPNEVEIGQGMVDAAKDRLIFGTYELCAVGNLNRKDVAALLSEVLGRKIEAASLSPNKPGDTSKDTDDKKQMSPMERMFSWYDHHDLLGNPLVLRAILGREPRTLRAYFEELAAQPQTNC